MRKNLFRKVALDKISSPEQLDQLITVTSPATWAALTAMALIITVAIVWSIFSRVPTTVTGQGMLIRSGGIFQVEAGGSGRLLSLSVDVGDIISKGQIIGTIDQKDLETQLASAQDKLQKLQQRTGKDFIADAEQLRLYQNALEEKQTTLNASIQAAEKRAAVLEKRIATNTELFNEGIISQQMLLKTIEEKNNNDETLGTYAGELKQLLVNKLQFEQQMNSERFNKESLQDEIHEHIELLTHMLSRSADVISPYNGRVVEIKENVGSLVTEGNPVVSVEPYENELQGLVYVSAFDGKKITPGMNVQVFPSTVKQEEFGYLFGTVKSVSLFPATYSGMIRVLENEVFVQSLTKQGAPFAVAVTLTADPSTVSKYRWSSGDGPKLPMETGTLCTAKVIIREERPIQLVMPFLKKLTKLASISLEDVTTASTTHSPESR